jgi:putative phosphoribosyl transferase
VPVAFEVAQALGAPMDVFVVRKLGMPGHEEFAMGAIASGGVVVLNDEVVRSGAVRRAEIDRVIESERRELERREHRYRGDRPPADIAGRTVILVDDGLATGSSMWAAVSALREEGPAHIVVAVPISSPAACDAFRGEVDEIICAMTPEPFYAVGLWYEDFSQTTDEEVHDLLARASGDAHGARAPARPETDAWIVHIHTGAVTLEGTLGASADATGIVLFAHGSGSSRHSPRNRQVAEVLRQAGLATLLIDLLTADEEAIDLRSRALRFDIDRLAERLVGAIDWLADDPITRALPVGLFGARTGAGAARVAAARRPDRVRAVVSRGGRPDLAGEALRMVEAPTLLLVGGRDTEVIALNEQAMARMLATTPRPEVRLTIIPGATHLFEEPGALEAVAREAREWFVHRLTAAHVEPASSR